MYILYLFHKVRRFLIRFRRLLIHRLCTMEAIKAHGGWVKDTMHNRCYAIVAYDEDTVETDQDTVGVDALFDGFVFADDGSPCGVPVEE